MDVSKILKRAAEKSNCQRVRYKEKNIPTSIENVTILPFFGDTRSSVVLSSLLLKRIKEELKSSKYFILLSWSGDEALYPYVDEYWQISDESILSKLTPLTNGFCNKSLVVDDLLKSLNQYFYDIMSVDDLIQYYDNGLKSSFFERFRNIKVSFPSIPSATSLGFDFSKKLASIDKKVFIYPYKNIYYWKHGKVDVIKTSQAFWSDLFDYLYENKFNPVIAKDVFSYDFSSQNKYLNIGFLDRIKSLSVMRSCGCVLDMFTGISRLSILARTPFVCLDERQRFNSVKDYEINDLCGVGIPKNYIFSFATLVEKGNSMIWRSNLFGNMLAKIQEIHSNMDRDSWPSPIESNEIVTYDSVRKKKAKKFGTRFIKIEKD